MVGSLLRYVKGASLWRRCASGWLIICFIVKALGQSGRLTLRLCSGLVFIPLIIFHNTVCSLCSCICVDFTWKQQQMLTALLLPRPSESHSSELWANSSCVWPGPVHWATSQQLEKRTLRTINKLSRGVFPRTSFWTIQPLAASAWWLTG